MSPWAHDGHARRTRPQPLRPRRRQPKHGGADRGQGKKKAAVNAPGIDACRCAEKEAAGPWRLALRSRFAEKQNSAVVEQPVVAAAAAAPAAPREQLPAAEPFKDAEDLGKTWHSVIGYGDVEKDEAE
eukprot:6616771-Prymnesium_polylepis.1